LNLLTGFFAALYMVFVVYRVPVELNQGAFSFGPLGHDSLKLPHEFMLQRRLYALEAWITFGFLSVYFALTSRK
jgi:hypothetical protein